MKKVEALDAFVFRARLERPVITSFGEMRDRPMVLVRVRDSEGAEGWGEVWCNFPSVGAEHRARLVASVFAPMLVGQEVGAPEAMTRRIAERSAVLALQSGEPGPLAQCVAGIDIALWDLVSRRAGVPLWRMLGGVSSSMPAYASGINPDAPAETARACRDAGYRAFKVKLGFGRPRDLANLRAVRDALGPEATLMADANQGWSADEAAAMLPALAEFSLGWIEEPVRADVPWEVWRRLRGHVKLAAGENLLGESQFGAAIASGALDVLQPDAAKWGGISLCLKVARAARVAGLRYCPHYLGGGVGLLASAHLLAAAGGDGLLEIDANANPLRALTCGAAGRVVDGRVTLGEAPGLGAPVDLDALAAYARPV